MKRLFIIAITGLMLSVTFIALSAERRSEVGESGRGDSCSYYNYERSLCLDVHRCSYDEKSGVCYTDNYPSQCRFIHGADQCNQTQGCSYEYSSHRCDEMKSPERPHRCKEFDYEKSLCLDQAGCGYDQRSGACYPY